MRQRFAPDALDGFGAVDGSEEAVDAVVHRLEALGGGDDVKGVAF
jgi:hypothetical protein